MVRYQSIDSEANQMMPHHQQVYFYLINSVLFVFIQLFPLGGIKQIKQVKKEEEAGMRTVLYFL